MTTTKRGIRALAGVLTAAGLVLAACGGPAPDTGTGRGVVQDVDVAGRQVTIEHGDIPGLMKAMTMTFSVADPVDLEGVEPGNRVDFEVKFEQGRYIVTDIGPVAP